MKKLIALALCLALCMSSGGMAAELNKVAFVDTAVESAGQEAEPAQNQYAGQEQTELQSAESSPAATQEPENQTGEALPRATGMTVMLYLCGSSLENAAEGYYSATRDILEIAESGFNAQEINLLVMTGGSVDWGLDFVADGKTSIYQIAGDSALLISDPADDNMGDPDTLSGFLNFARQHYPAEEYALILWDHGGGSLMGICSDENHDGDSLDMQELAKALQDGGCREDPLAWIGFDACLMSSAEVAWVMSPYARCMVASAESEPADGWDYSFLRGLESDGSPYDTGRRIADAYMAYYKAEGYRGRDLTMACLDLSKISAVREAADNCFGEMRVDADTFAAMSRARRAAVSYGRDAEDPATDFDLADLGDLAVRMGGDEDSELLAALRACVVYSAAHQEGCSGLSVYFPFYNKRLYPYLIGSYAQLDFSGGYTAFISSFGRYLTADHQTEQPQSDTASGDQPSGGLWSGLDGVVSDIQKDRRTTFSLQLTQAQQAYFGEASMAALQRVDGDAYRLASEQDARLGANGLVTGSYVHASLFVTGADGAPMQDAPLGCTVRDDGIYVAQVKVTDAAGKQQDARLILIRDDKNNLVTVDSVQLYDAAIGGYTPRHTAPLDSFVRVAWTVQDRIPTRNEKGALRDFREWEILRSTEYGWNLNEEWQLAFVENYLDTASVWVSFRLTDVFNSTAMTEPVRLDQRPEENGGMTLTYDDDLVLVEDADITGSGGKLRLSARLTNRTEAECMLIAENVCVNGLGTDVRAEVYGNGANDGLMPGESQIMMLTLPAEGGIDFVTFDLVLVDAGGAEQGRTAVSLTISRGE